LPVALPILDQSGSVSVLCIIPARGGSVRLPRKNLMPVAGQPLLAYSLIHARTAQLVDETVISTDDDEIASLGRRYGADIVMRPPELSEHTSTSESALLHVLDARHDEGRGEPDLVVFLQCTSPVRRLNDIDNAIRLLRTSEADSVFSACENSRLIWGMEDEEPVALNYDWKKRKREQEMARQYRENGSIYIFTPALLRKTGNRMGGRKRIYEMDYWSSFQLDLPEHAELLDWILQRPEYAVPEIEPSAMA
jgi:CMP-N,N'-diacetyllegionaminic acid synthase